MVRLYKVIKCQRCQYLTILMCYNLLARVTARVPASFILIGINSSKLYIDMIELK
jgi:hypothetical protein